MKKLYLILLTFFSSLIGFSQTDLSVTVDNGQTVYIGDQTIIYTVTVENLGPTDAVNVTVENLIPTQFSSFSWTGTNGSTGTNVPLSDTIPLMTVGEVITYTITAQVVPNPTGNLTNTATVTATTPDSDTSNNSADDVDTLGTSWADLAVTITDNQYYYSSGQTIIYNVTITNFGPSNVTSVAINSNYPTGIYYISWVGSNGSYGVNNAQLATSAAINAGQTITYTVTIEVPLGFSGDLPFTVTAGTGSIPDTNPSNNSATDTDVDGDSPFANISVDVQDGTTTYTPGGTIVYTFDVTNNGPLPASNVNVSCPIPSGITSFSWTGSNGTSGTDVDLADIITSLASDETVTYTITLDVPGTYTGDLILNASANSSLTSDPDTADNATQDINTLIPTGSDIVVYNSNGQSVYTSGTTTVYTVTVTNNGPEVATNVDVFNAIPTGITVFSWTGDNGSSGTNVDLADTLATLNVGETVTYTITLDIPVTYTGDLVNETTITSTSVDPDPSCPFCIDTDVATSPVAGADLEVTLTDGTTTYTAGTTQIYTLTITNNGPDDALNVSVSGGLPAGTTVMGWTASNGTNGLGSLNETIANLPAGTTITYTLEVVIPSDFDPDTNLANTISVASSTPDPFPDCLGCTDVDFPDPQADLVTIKTDNQTTYVAGETNFYVINITNYGPSDAFDVTVTDNQPTNTTMTWTNSLGASGTGSINDIIASIPVNQTVSYNVYVAIPETYNTNINITNTVAVTSSTNDPNPGCSACTDTDTPASQFISVEAAVPANNATGYTVEELVQDVLIHSECAQVSNITYSNCGIGYFESNNADFPLGSGVVMTTGPLANVPGPNNAAHPSANCGFDNDTTSSLFTYIQSLGIDPSLNDYNDVITIDFDFLPLTDNMSFDFLFASEEYGTYQCSFADAFAFFLTNTVTSVTTNLALVPGTTDPISVLTIRDNSMNGSCASVNPAYFGVNNSINSADAPINFNGQTVVMTAQSTVTPNELYHIQLIIGDRNDGALNSAIFIGAGSFNVGTAQIEYQVGIGTETSDILVSNGFALCPGETKELDSGLDPATYNFEWTLNGVVLAGETGPTITADQPGVYCVEASNISGGSCIQKDCITIEYLDGFTVNPTPDDYEACENADGTVTYYFNDHAVEILGPSNDPADYDITYYLNAADAQAGFPQIPAVYTTTVSPLHVYVRVESFVFTCPAFTEFDAVAIPCGTVAAYQAPDLIVCDDASNDEIEIFDLTVQDATVLGSQTPVTDYAISYYTSQAGADAGTFDLATPATAYQNTSNPQIIYVRVELTTTGDYATSTFQLIVEAAPVVDEPGDVIVCGQYTLPALTVGNYFDGTGGTGTPYFAGDVISTSMTMYVYEEVGTSPNICSDEHTFTINILTSPVVDEPTDVTACDNYTLPALTVGNYFDGTGGTGTPYSAGDVINTVGTTTLYVYAETGVSPNICSDEHMFTVTINQTPVVDEPADVTACDNYTLPALTVGNYFDGTNGTGTPYSAGDVISTTTTLYVYEETGTAPDICSDEHMFTVTINTTPVVDEPTDVTACDNYTLPALTVGNYFDGTNGTGTPYSAGDVISTTTTLYVYAETATTPNCFDEHTFTVTINPSPVVDEPTDVTACDNYTLPALTVGNYFDGTNGTGTPYSAGDVINTVGITTLYVYAETGTSPNICSDEHMFTVTINQTPVVDEPTDVTACDNYTLPALTVGNYFDGTNGTGTPYSAGDVISTTTTLYVYAETATTPNCTDEHTFTVTINPSPVVDEPTDVTACDNYTLPALTVGNYFDGTGGTGTPYSAGDVISTTTTLYVYEETGTAPNICSDEHMFTVTINTTPVVDEPTDVTVCDNYTLPALTAGNYFDGTNGTGTPYFAGDVISTTTTLYVYAETATTPNCFDEHTFTVTINPSPVVDEPTDVTACDTYTLPALTVGNYFDGTNGTGTPYFAGDVINTVGTTTLYVYAETATTPNCTDEHMFTVTINTTPVVDEPTDVTACDNYTLPALTVGNYFDGTGGTGTAYFAGDVISTTTTLYVYAETATTPNCTDEHTFTVTINPSPVVDEPTDVTACDNYTLPALTVGNYFDGTNGTGTPYFAGDVINTVGTTTLYVYAETATTPNCTDEHTFTVTINPSPVVDEPTDVTACDNYTLPALTVGNYFDGTNGTGTAYFAGDVISTTTTLYVYEETGTSPNICSDEHMFTVTINATPVVDEPTDVTACDNYTLPTLTVGDYFDGTGGTGTPYFAGDVISTTTTLYVYAETATTPNCTDEHTFTVTINPSPVVDEPTDVTACDNYTLPALTVGNYFDGTGGAGTPYFAGDVISTTTTLYVYAETATTPNCTDEHMFTVTINPLPTASFTTASNAVCLNGTTTLTFTGTPNAEVTFTDGTNNYTVTIDASGTIDFTTPMLTVDTTFSLVDVTLPATGCSQALSGSETIVISPTPEITSVTYTTEICEGTLTDIVVNLNNATGYTWVATLANIDATAVNQTGDQTDINQIFNLQNPLIPGYVTIAIQPELTGGNCAGVVETIQITINPVPEITNIVESSTEICNNETVDFELSGEPSGLEYQWTAILTGVMTDDGVTSGTITTNELELTMVLVNPNTQGSFYVEFTPVLGSCIGTTVSSQVITVNPIPGAVVASPTIPICSGDTAANAFDIQLGFPLITGTTVEWVVFDSSGVSGATDGSSATTPFEINDVLTATGSSPGYVTYRIWTISPAGCQGGYVDFTVVVNPNPMPVLQGGSICVDGSGATFQSFWLQASGNFTANSEFVWYEASDTTSPIAITTIPQLEIFDIGSYYVEVTNQDTNCMGTSDAVPVVATSPATLVETTVTDYFSDSATVIVTATVDNGYLLYQMDEGGYQDSNVFTGVSSGEHTVEVIDSQGCTYLTTTVMVIDYPKYFTPNGDGYNDTWNITGLNQPDAKLYIFDRYGKLLKQISATDTSNGWDGTYNGNQMPSTDYWFSLQYTENNVAKEFKAHFSLKR